MSRAGFQPVTFSVSGECYLSLILSHLRAELRHMVCQRPLASAAVSVIVTQLVTRLPGSSFAVAVARQLGHLLTGRGQVCSQLPQYLPG